MYIPAREQNLAEHWKKRKWSRAFRVHFGPFTLINTFAVFHQVGNRSVRGGSRKGGEGLTYVGKNSINLESNV
jgi:hypothetical protein